MNISDVSVSTYDGSNDIRDLIRSKGPPYIPKLPEKNGRGRKSHPRLSNVRRDSLDAPETKRKNSRDRALRRRSIASISSSDDDHIVSDTNSTTDTDNERTSESRSGSKTLSVDQLKNEYNNLNRLTGNETRDTRRSSVRGTVNAIRRRSESLMKKRRSRSRSRESSRKDPSGTTYVPAPRTEGKGLFADRPPRGGKAKEESDKEEKPRSRARSRSRIRSKLRSISRNPKKDLRARSQSRTPKDRTRDRSKSRTLKDRPRNRSQSRAHKDRTRDRSQSRKPKDRTRDRSQSRKPKDRSRNRSQSRTNKDRTRDRSHSRKPKDRSRARSKSRARSPIRAHDDNGKINKANRSKSKRRPSIQHKRDKENGIPKDSDARSDTSASLPVALPFRMGVAEPTEGANIVHKVSMDGSIDSMAIKKASSVDGIQRRHSDEKAQRKNSFGWYKPTAAHSMEESSTVGKPPGRNIKRSVLRTDSNESSESRNSRDSGPKLPKRDWKASIKSMFKASLDQMPTEKEVPKPETRSKQWQADLTNLDGDESTVATFERLWDKEQEPSLRKMEDESVVDSAGTRGMESQSELVGEAGAPTYAKDDHLHAAEAQIQGFKDEITSLQKTLEVKDADIVSVRAQLDTSIMESERHRSETQDALEELKCQITDLREALEDRELKIASLQKQLDLAYSENNQEMYKAEVELKVFREKVSALSESLDQKDFDIKCLRDELERANLKLSTEMDQGRDDADHELKEFREQVASLQDMVSEKIKAVLEMQQKLDETESENKLMLEELDELLKEKNAAEEKAAKAVAGGDDQGDAMNRIRDLEVELDNATKVANLQLEELDEQVDELKDKLKGEREDSALQIQSRDATIEELTTKLRKYEAVPSTTSHSFGFSKHVASVLPSSSDSVTSGKSLRSGRASASFALPDTVQDTRTIYTEDVTDMESAKQKVYEARADATSVRESLEISTKKCAELILANEALTKRNSELVDTTWERDDLKDKVRDWTAQTYNWKRRAEEAESKLANLQGGDGENKSSIEAQGDMIAAAMDRSGGNDNNGEKKTGWSLFGRSTNSNHNSMHRSDTRSSDGEGASEAKDAQIAGLNEVIAKLRSELVQMSSAHKEEVYLTKKRITQLEGENEALKVQNETLEKLSRFHADD